MSTYTNYYNLDKYESTDRPNLRDQYNSAMDKIDSALHTQAGSIASTQTTVNQIQTAVNTHSTEITNLNAAVQQAQADATAAGTAATAAGTAAGAAQADATAALAALGGYKVSGIKTDDLNSLYTFASNSIVDSSRPYTMSALIIEDPVSGHALAIGQVICLTSRAIAQGTAVWTLEPLFRLTDWEADTAETGGERGNFSATIINDAFSRSGSKGLGIFDPSGVLAFTWNGQALSEQLPAGSGITFSFVMPVRRRSA